MCCSWAASTGRNCSIEAVLLQPLVNVGQSSLLLANLTVRQGSAIDDCVDARPLAISPAGCATQAARQWWAALGFRLHSL